jgi:hypothetical protein
MYAVIYQGRVQARGTLERMKAEVQAYCKFTGLEPFWYQIVKL